MIEVDEESGELTLKRKLEELNGFLTSWMHEAFIAGLLLDAQIKEREIIALDPLTRAEEIELLKLRGDLRTIQSFPTLFEEARDNLEDRFDQLELAKLNRENQQSEQNE